MRRFLTPAALSAALISIAPRPAQATEPKAGLTKGEAIHAFVDAVNLACLYSRISNTPLDALPEGVEDDLVPADAQDRSASVAPKDQPLWVSRTLGRLLHVFNDKTGACVVVAQQLPVQMTLDAEARVIRAGGATAYHEEPFAPGYNPMGYVFTRTLAGGDKVTLRMEGAEPGRPGHAFRFSLIVVHVTRIPAPP